MNIEEMSKPEIKSLRLINRVLMHLVNKNSKDLSNAIDELDCEEAFDDALDQLHHMNAHIADQLKKNATV